MLYSFFYIMKQIISNNVVRDKILLFLHNIISRNENPMSFYRIIWDKTIYDLGDEKLLELYNLCNRE